MKNNTAQQNIPSGWKQVSLGDLVSVTTGSRDANHGSPDGQYPFFTCAQKVSKINEFSFDTEAVLIAGNGDFNVKYYKGKFDAYQRTYVLSDFKNTTGHFVYQKAKQALNDIMRNNQGSSVKFIKMGDLTDYEFIFPPIKEQQKIAEILGTVDEDIAKTQELIEATEKLKRGLMQQLFTRGIGHTKFKETKMGQIPEEWEVLELGKVCDVRDGTHSSPKYHEEGIPLITSKNLVDTILDFENVSLISEIDFQEIERRSKVDGGDILFGMIGTIGNPVIVRKDRDFAIKNVALIKFTDSKMNNAFVLNFLKSTHTEKQFNQKKGGSTQKFIALGVIRQILITVPSVTEQKKIAEILSAVDEKTSVNKKLKEKLTFLKKGLMQDLLSGNKRVKV